MKAYMQDLLLHTRQGPVHLQPSFSGLDPVHACLVEVDAYMEATQFGAWVWQVEQLPGARTPKIEDRSA